MSSNRKIKNNRSKKPTQNKSRNNRSKKPIQNKSRNNSDEYNLKDNLKKLYSNSSNGNRSSTVVVNNINEDRKYDSVNKNYKTEFNEGDFIKNYYFRFEDNLKDYNKKMNDSINILENKIVGQNLFYGAISTLIVIAGVFYCLSYYPLLENMDKVKMEVSKVKIIENKLDNVNVNTNLKNKETKELTIKINKIEKRLIKLETNKID